MKRVCLILVAMALLVCSLTVPVSADEVEGDVTVLADVSGCGFTATSCVSSGGTMVRLCASSPSNTISLLRGLGVNSSVLIYSCTNANLYGYYFDSQGILCSRTFVNSLGTANASVLGVRSLSALEAVSSGSFLHPNSYSSSGWVTYEHPIFYDAGYAEVYSDFLTSSLYVINWSGSMGVGTGSTASYVSLPLYTKNSTDTVIGTSSSSKFVFGYENGYHVGAFTWDSASISPDDNTSTDPYIYVSIPASVTKGMPIIPWARLENAGDIPGNILCFLSGHNSAYTKLTESSALENTWTLDCGRDETASTLTLTFMVDGRPDIYTTCTVAVVGSTTDNEGSSGDLPGSGNGGSDQEENDAALGEIQEGITSLPGKILDGIVGLFVPDAESMAQQQEQWTQLLADRFGAVYEAGEIVSEVTDIFTLQDVQSEIQFPSVTVPFGTVDWTFGGWTVDVVPDGFEFLIEILKKIIDIVCTFAFVNAMKNRFDRVLEEKA